MYSLLVGFSLQPMETDGTDPNGPAPPSARPIGSWGWIELAHSSARRHELAQAPARDRPGAERRARAPLPSAGAGKRGGRRAGTGAPARDRAQLRKRDRPPREGRSPPDARESGASGRSRAARLEARDGSGARAARNA